MMKSVNIYAQEVLIGTAELVPQGNELTMGTLLATPDYERYRELFAEYSIIACDLRARKERAEEYEQLTESVRALHLKVVDSDGMELRYRKIEITDVSKWSGGGTPTVVTLMLA